MGKGRLEAFTDGVMAIIITIMVLELRTPAGSSLSDLAAVAPTLLAYLLAFANVGVFWNNHHHMFHLTERINGKVLWANLFLLFWLSLVPFAIRWVDQTHFQALPTAAYGFILAMAALGYFVLERVIIAADAANSKLAAAIGAEWKGKVSLALFAAGAVLAFVRPWMAIAIYVAVVLGWFTPDRRIEAAFKA